MDHYEMFVAVIDYSFHLFGGSAWSDDMGDDS